MSYLTRYDMINVKQFNDGKGAGYLCSICGQYTMLDDSISHRGYNLVCNRCVYKIGDVLNNMSIGEILDKIHAKGLDTEKNEKRGVNDV